MFLAALAILLAVLLALLIFVVWYAQHHLEESEKKSVLSEAEREKIKADKVASVASQKLWRCREIAKWFQVDFDRINEKGTQDEIVRCVNILACRTAKDCFDQSCSSAEKRDILDDLSAKSKRAWLEARNSALEICPELEGRMPHFGEFEPLKSYNAEHLIQAPK